MFLTYLLSLVQKMEILSTIKPDIPKKPEVKIEYNNRSIESFIKNGFVDAIPRLVLDHMTIRLGTSQLDNLCV